MVKRLFDLLCAVAGLLVLALPLAVVAVVIKLHDGGAVLFRQQRVGRGGEPFMLWKFRTMRENADKEGPSLTVGADPRITPIGAFLRRFKLDELPQLVNVVRGEMSLVGPRPEVPEYVALYAPEQRAVLDLMPGITDPASIEYRNESELLSRSEDPIETYVNEIMPDKIRMNLEYAARANVWTDFGVIVRTVVPFCR
ncbi:MAG: sugar transferase [Acidobacteriota bacterium]|jgi:lipopolysaccharide/colanic/teichoic acid biosynthesis glycosyltransferase